MAGNADNITIGAAVIEIDGTDIGFTQGGSTIEYAREMLKVMADQKVGVVKMGRTSETANVKFALLEVSLEQMRIAMMQPALNLSGSTLNVGYSDSCFTDEHEIILTGPAPECGVRTFTINRGVADGTVNYEMKRDTPTTLAMQFECLKDDDGFLFSVTDA